MTEYRVIFNFENIPNFMHELAKPIFVKAYNEVVNPMNERLESINQEWDKTGESAMFGDYLEDTNPKYVAFIDERIQDLITHANSKYKPIGVRLGEYGLVEGYIAGIPNSRIYITIEEIGS